MAELQQFKATNKEFRLTEAQALRMRKRLFALRKQYILHIWEPQLELDLTDMYKLEAKIGRLEHKLAHAVITG